MARQRVPKRLKRLVEYWQPRLKLADWTIKVRVGTTKNDCAAENHSQPEYKEALIEFNLDLVPEAELEDYVVHELSHCHVERLAQVALDNAPAVMHKVISDMEEDLATMIEKIALGLDRMEKGS